MCLSELTYVVATSCSWRTPNIVILDLSNEDSGEKTLPDIGHDTFKYVATRIFGRFVITWFHLPDQFIGAVGATVVILLVFHPRVRQPLSGVFDLLTGCSCPLANERLPCVILSNAATADPPPHLLHLCVHQPHARRVRRGHVAAGRESAVHCAVRLGRRALQGAADLPSVRLRGD